jgi:hypothetical protein
MTFRELIWFGLRVGKRELGHEGEEKKSQRDSSICDIIWKPLT